MSVRIKRGSSRLSHAELVVVDGIEFWSRPSIPVLTPSHSDKQYTVDDGKKINDISYVRYKRDDWWWVIAHRNDLRLLPGDLIAGNRIVITDASQVRRELF